MDTRLRYRGGGLLSTDYWNGRNVRRKKLDRVIDNLAKASDVESVFIAGGMHVSGVYSLDGETWLQAIDMIDLLAKRLAENG